MNTKAEETFERDWAVVQDQKRLKELPPLNIYKRLSTIPGVLVPWSDMVKAIYAFDLPARWREVAICRQAAISNANYEWMQHKTLARAQNITAKQLDEIRNSSQVTTLSEEENVICAICDELVHHNAIIDSTLKRDAIDLLGKRNFEQLVVTVSFYCAVGMFTNALDVPMESRPVLKGSTPL
jgi:alkylhydroperoxidase family enzyme